MGDLAPSRLYTAQEAADALRVSRQALHDSWRRGAIVATFLTQGGRPLFEQCEIERFQKRRPDELRSRYQAAGAASQAKLKARIASGELPSDHHKRAGKLGAASKAAKRRQAGEGQA